MKGTIEGLAITAHARRRMQTRGIPPAVVASALQEGREVLCRGAVLYVVGQREVAKARERGLRLEGALGLHVICSREGTIITVYRNRRRLSLRDTKYRQVPRMLSSELLEEAA